MEALKVAALCLLGSVCFSDAKPPHNPLKEIASLEQKFDMRFKEEVLIKDGTKVWIFEFAEPVHDMPIIVELPPFPSEEVIKFATMSAAGEVELLYLLKEKHDQEKGILNGTDYL